jgi:hypothetical protein
MDEMNLHRNNAAEWVMWVCLLPAFWVVKVFGKINTGFHRRGAENAEKKLD